MKKQKANEYIVECPECKRQARLTTPGNLISSAIVVLSTSGIVCIILGLVLSFLIIPVLLIPVGVVLLIASFICLVISPIYAKRGKYTIVCKHCNSKFKLSKEEYKAMNN